MSDTHNDEHVDHPDSSQYIVIGIILAVLTAIEVAISFSSVPSGVAIPSLIVLTILKFLLVVLWFMHLRFDSGWFRRLFLFGLGVAIAVYVIAISLLLFAGGNQQV